MQRALLYTFRLTFLVTLCTVTWLALADPDLLPSATHWWDKGNHILAFLVLAFLIDYSYPGRPSPTSRLSWAKWAALLVYGVTLEVMQWSFGERFFELGDIAGDMVGIGLYAALLGPVAGIRILRDLRGPTPEASTDMTGET